MTNFLFKNAGDGSLSVDTNRSRFGRTGPIKMLSSSSMREWAVLFHPRGAASFTQSLINHGYSPSIILTAPSDPARVPDWTREDGWIFNGNQYLLCNNGTKSLPLADIAIKYSNAPLPSNAAFGAFHDIDNRVGGPLFIPRITPVLVRPSAFTFADCLVFGLQGPVYHVANGQVPAEKTMVVLEGNRIGYIHGDKYLEPGSTTVEIENYNYGGISVTDNLAIGGINQSAKGIVDTCFTGTIETFGINRRTLNSTTIKRTVYPRWMKI